MTILSDLNSVDDTPIELTIPLPLSAPCSEKDYGEEPPALEAFQSQPQLHNTTGLVSEDGLLEGDSNGVGPEEPPTTGPQMATLDEFAFLGALERDYAFRVNLLRERLEHLQYVFGMGRRLARVCSQEYRSMAASFETDDQARFLETYEASQRLSGRIRALGRPDHLGVLDPDPQKSIDPASEPSNWLEALPMVHQKNVLHFLTGMRSKTDYLASHLSKLSSTALIALTAPYQSNLVYDSVLPGSYPPKSQGHGKPLARDYSPSQSMSPTDLGQSDPIFLLLYGIFDDSFGPGSTESRRRTEVWATACARVMASGQRGSDEFVTTALTAFANLEMRPLKLKLESYLAKVLKDGSFLLSQSAKPADFQEPIESRNAKAAVAASSFFESAITELLQFLAEDPLSVVNASLRDLVRSILGKLDKPKLRDRAEIFILSKWFFGTYITDILTRPESYGVLMAHHIGDAARRVILKDLAYRLQRQVFDLTSPWKSSLISGDNEALIQRIFEVFRPSASTAFLVPEAIRSKTDETYEHIGLLTLSLRDVMVLIRTIHPASATSPATDANIDSGNISSTSSIADASTLTSGSTGCGSRVPSSTAPSLSGTSMTSNTILSEDPIRDMGTVDQENVECRESSMIEGIHPSTREDDRDHVSSLHETLKVIECMIEDEPNPDLVSSSSNWARVRISKDGRTLSTNFAVDDAELQESRSDAEPAESPSTTDQDLVDMYEAVSEATEDQDRLLNLQHRLQGSGNEQHPADLCYRTLLLLFEDAQYTCHSNFDFQQAHFWWRAQQSLGDLWARDQSEEAFDKVLQRFVNKKRDTIDGYAKSIRNYKIQALSIERSAALHKDILSTLEEERQALRLKMWYVTDVKNSALYADALNVTRALRSMTDVGRSRQAASITSWARQRLRPTSSTDKAAAQTLETLTASRDYGGPTRLADQQAELTTRWLTKNSVENFCKGEERIHRFCYEVQKCANKLAGSSIQESPVLWASNLFRREKAIFDKHRNTASLGPLGPFGDRHGYHESWRGRTVQAPPSPVSPTGAIGPFKDLSPSKSRPFNDFWKGPKASSGSHEHGLGPPMSASNNPTSWFAVDNRTSFTTNPVVTAAQNSRSVSFSKSPDTAKVSDTRTSFACKAKQTVISLLLSDLGYLIWNDGSETDLWINKAQFNHAVDSPASPRNVQLQLGNAATDTSPNLTPGDALSDSTVTVQRYHEGEHRPVEAPIKLKEDLPKPSPVQTPHSSDDGRPFKFSNAFSSILERMSTSSDPHKKLDLLSELEMLVFTSLQDRQRARKSAKITAQTSQTDVQEASPKANNVGAGGISIPRTKATSLEEVIANCTERRAATLTFTTAKSSARHLRLLSSAFPSVEEQPIGTDEIVSALLDIFRDDSLRPPTLYRDLQLIAAHIPSSILDQTAKGKAFWDAGLAALALKEERISAIITRATRITTYHISASKETDSSTFASSYSADLVDTTLSHAAQLWTIAAKEGSPVAARELALFYLTHPELVARVTMPLSRVKDVFKTVTSQERGVDTGGLNPLTFAVVFHWMEVAANGGDKDARDFLRGTGDLSGAR
ncbi:MAG: hypothetical protein Q9191_004031 [Dirinaria sp. TL-2023a]